MENRVGCVKAIPTAIDTLAVAMDVSKLRLPRYPLTRHAVRHQRQNRSPASTVHTLTRHYEVSII